MVMERVRPWRRISAVTFAPCDHRLTDHQTAFSMQQSNLVDLHRMPDFQEVTQLGSTVPASTRYCFPPVSIIAYMIAFLLVSRTRMFIIASERGQELLLRWMNGFGKTRKNARPDGRLQVGRWGSRCLDAYREALVLSGACYKTSEKYGWTGSLLPGLMRRSMCPHSLHYGLAAFGGIRCYRGQNGRPFQAARACGSVV